MMKFVFISCVVSLWITSCLAQSGPGFFVSAPDVIRVGVEEKVLVSVHNTEGSSSIPIRLLLQSYPNRDITYAEELVEVHPDHPQIVALRVNPTDVETTTKDVRQYTSLVVKSESTLQETRKAILLSYKSGYVFIQTDKPIYTPEHDVKIRVISLDQDMKPSNVPIKFEIRNPQDIIVKFVENAKSDTGIITETFHFPPHPLFGNWSVVAYYGHKQQHNTTVKFTVKDYVLPTFWLSSTPTKNVILPNTDELLVDIVSKTTFGKPVHGDYYVEYHALLPGGEMRPLTSAAGKLESDGRAVLGLKTSNTNWSDIYRGARLHIHVSVTEQSSGKTEGANNTQVMFVDTPYKFKWDKTVKYFKRGLPLEVKVDLKYANGQPAANVPVNAITKVHIPSGDQITLSPIYPIPISNAAGQIRFMVTDAPADATKLTIELETADSSIPGYNAIESHVLWPQQASSNGNYLVAHISASDIQVGDTISVELTKSGSIATTSMYMFVVSKGQIVAHQTTSSADRTIHVDLMVTFDMVPHARLIAYFIDENNQIVADSVWFDVTHTCKSDVDVYVDTSAGEYKPKDEIALQIEGDPGTYVGILAIDSAVYLLQDGDKLTGDTMFKKMDDYDLGCGPGGGRNVEAIFMGSGVTVITSADLETDLRQDETCAHAAKRRRRDIVDDLASQYEHDSVHQTFCLTGATDHRNNDAECDQDALNLAREHSLPLADERIQAFYNCCIHIVNFETVKDEEIHPEEEVRSDFPETWIFEQVELDRFGSADFSFVAPDSATTWIVQAIGVSSTSGMCVAEPAAVRVQPDILTKVHLPPSVVRTEQVEIVATVSNYLQYTLEADVSLLGVDGVCSETAPGTWSGIRQFDILPSDTVTVKFNIVPLGIGAFPIEIRVVTPSGVVDTVRDVLKVVPEGYPRKHMIQIPLNPTGSNHQAINLTSLTEGSVVPLTHQNVPTGKDKHQRDHIGITLPAGTVPGSASVSMHVTGNLMGHAIPAAIEGHRLTSDLDEPNNGNGEIAAADTAANIYVLKYLKETSQLTTNLTERLHQNIQTGVDTQYTYRKQDSGSYAFHPNAGGSTWLTAFVNKIFCHAREFHFIDPHVTVTATNWLINTAQRPDGSFHEVFRVHLYDISGALDDDYLGNPDAAKTAYVLISLMECNSTAMQYHNSILRATLYLEGAFTTLERPFDLAIVTYALTLVGSDRAYEANEQLLEHAVFDDETDTHHWEENLALPSNDPNRVIDRTRESHWKSVAIETTGYALLAQLKLSNIEYSHSIANWLSQHQGFGFTQDTVVALQALSEYAIWSNGERVNLQTTITTDMDSSFQHTVHIHPGNALLQQSIQGPIDGQLIVDTKGTGTGQLAVQVKYHTVDDIYNNCLFDFSVTAGEGDLPVELNNSQRFRRSTSNGARTRRMAGARYVGFVNVCTMYLGNAQSSGQAVIDVGMYSGFRPIKSTLDQILNQDSRVLRYEITNRSVIFHVDQVPNSGELCLPFEILRDYVVGKIQPVAVRVYSYHEPERDCVKFYHPSSGPTMLASVCEGQTCVCAEGNCPPSPCGHEGTLCNSSCQQLLDKVYFRNSSDPRTKSTFAYKVSFNRQAKNSGFEIFHMNILSTYLIGNDTALERTLQENASQIVVRQFWQSLNCRQEILRKPRKEFLVIGTGGLRYRDENGDESFKYILDDTYIFEDWPRGQRATRSRFSAQVSKLEALSLAISEGGECST